MIKTFEDYVNQYKDAIAFKRLPPVIMREVYIMTEWERDNGIRPEMPIYRQLLLELKETDRPLYDEICKGNEFYEKAVERQRRRRSKYRETDPDLYEEMMSVDPDD